MSDATTGERASSRRLNVTHLVAGGVLVASLVVQWTVSRVAVGSIQLLSPKAGWELAPILLVVIVLLALLGYADSRPEPVRGLVRVIGLQALLLAGVMVLSLEALVSLLGIIWDTGSGALRAGAGVWMAAIAGLLLVVVGDRDPLARLLPGGDDLESTATRGFLAVAWFSGVATTIWWTGWRNTEFAEVGPVVVVASAVPVVGVVSLVAVVSCWIGLAAAIAGRRLAAGVLMAIGSVLLITTVTLTGFLSWAVDALPIDELLKGARNRAIEWTQSVELPEILPDPVEEGLVPAIESADVVVIAQVSNMWIMVAITALALTAVAVLSRRWTSSGDPQDPAPRPEPHGRLSPAAESRSLGAEPRHL